jgi:methylmalonyl-CoA/ethylmalonyl-CoA epimerase
MLSLLSRRRGRPASSADPRAPTRFDDDNLALYACIPNWPLSIKEGSVTLVPPASALSSVLHGRRVHQVGVVVRDLDRSLAKYTQLWGIGPWHIYVWGPETVEDLRYRGAPASCTWRVALAGSSPQMELVQPLSGKNIYDDWLDQHGEGIHHFGVAVATIRDAEETFAGQGYEMLMAGRGVGLHGDGGFAYFDTRADFGVILEAIEIPTTRRSPNAIWPST